jgi:hypothetical protein
MNPDDTLPDREKLAHQIATTTATRFLHDVVEADLDWAEMAICMETTLSIVVATIVQGETGGQNRQAFLAAEIINLVAERSIPRVTRVLLEPG